MYCLRLPWSAQTLASKAQTAKKTSTTEIGEALYDWRRDPESNRARRICNPLHNRFAIAPQV